MTIFHVIKYTLSYPIKLEEYRRIPFVVKDKAFEDWINDKSITVKDRKTPAFLHRQYREKLIKNLLEYEEPE